MLVVGDHAGASEWAVCLLSTRLILPSTNTTKQRAFIYWHAASVVGQLNLRFLVRAVASQEFVSACLSPRLVSLSDNLLYVPRKRLQCRTTILFAALLLGTRRRCGGQEDAWHSWSTLPSSRRELLLFAVVRVDYL